jgi:SMC interacting uncharacterized protein involved in chromosome segregation
MVARSWQRIRVAGARKQLDPSGPRSRTPVGQYESDVSCVRFNDVRRVMTQKRRRQAMNGINRMSRTLRHKYFYSALLSKFPPAYDYLRSNTLAPDIRRISFSFTTATVNMNRLAIAD